jgi:hypothetical protein
MPFTYLVNDPFINKFLKYLLIILEIINQIRNFIIAKQIPYQLFIF